MPPWPQPLVEPPAPIERRMQMLYGVNQADECREFAIGATRETIRARLQAIDTRLIRLFLFDKQAPDPVKAWREFAAYVQAVLDVGAVPMITFAKFRRPLDDARAIRWFAEQSADVVWGCLEQWGPEVVRDWYWCVWNEPNNAWVGGGLAFHQYRRIYEAVAEGALRWLEPHLNGRRPLIGGPAVEGFEPFWLDWPWRFVTEIDNALIGFLDWHRYAEWRNLGEKDAPRDEAAFRALLLSQAPDFELRARAINRLLQGRDILNICGELNAHSHYTIPVRERFNYGELGAAFYITAVLHLLRAGVHAEMYWTGTEDSGGYGMMNKYGVPRPAYHAKRLLTHAVRWGDHLHFPAWAQASFELDGVVARGDDGRLSAVLVHLADGPATYTLPELFGDLPGADLQFKLDAGTGNRIVEQRAAGTVQFQGYGVAVATTAPLPGVPE